MFFVFLNIAIFSQIGCKDTKFFAFKQIFRQKLCENDKDLKQYDKKNSGATDYLGSATYDMKMIQGY